MPIITNNKFIILISTPDLNNVLSANKVNVIILATFVELFLGE